MYVFLFCNLLGLSLASSRKQLCYPRRAQTSRAQNSVLKSPERQASSQAKITQYQLADWKGRAANSAERWALRWIFKNRKETQRRTDQLCLHGCNHLREEGIILFYSSRRCNPSWQPWLVAQFPLESLPPALVWDSLPTATTQGQILAQLMPRRPCNQPGQSFLGFLPPRTQHSCIPSVPRGQPCNSKLSFAPLPSWSP